MNENAKEIELDQHFIFMSIPEDTVALSITATLLDDNGNPYQVHSKMTASDIFQARKDFLDHVEDGDYFDDDVRFVLTEQGREWLEQRRQDQQNLNPSNSTTLSE